MKRGEYQVHVSSHQSLKELKIQVSSSDLLLWLMLICESSEICV